MSANQFIDLLVLPFTHEIKEERYGKLPGFKDPMTQLGAWDHSFSGPAELVARMDAAGIAKGLIPANCGGIWEVPYEYVHALVSEYPDRLYGMAGIDPSNISDGLKRLEFAVRELGFVGAHSYPHWFRLSPDDRVYYPFYAKCVELGIPIQIQVGQAYQRDLRSVGRPSAIDAIAVDFPDLKLIGIHTGYPWEREMVSVAWKHPNVYVGADTHHPRAWAPELVEFMKGAGREKVMFGTNYPILDFSDALAGVDALGLDDETKEHLLYKNVRRVYGLS